MSRQCLTSLQGLGFALGKGGFPQQRVVRHNGATQSFMRSAPHHTRVCLSDTLVMRQQSDRAAR